MLRILIFNSCFLLSTACSNQVLRDDATLRPLVEKIIDLFQYDQVSTVMFNRHAKRELRDFCDNLYRFDRGCFTQNTKNSGSLTHLWSSWDKNGDFFIDKNEFHHALSLMDLDNNNYTTTLE